MDAKTLAVVVELLRYLNLGVELLSQVQSIAKRLQDAAANPVTDAELAALRAEGEEALAKFRATLG